MFKIYFYAVLNQWLINAVLAVGGMAYRLTVAVRRQLIWLENNIVIYQMVTVYAFGDTKYKLLNLII